jgi:hypothetical protein
MPLIQLPGYPVITVRQYGMNCYHSSKQKELWKIPLQNSSQACY